MSCRNYDDRMIMPLQSISRINYEEKPWHTCTYADVSSRTYDYSKITFIPVWENFIPAVSMFFAQVVSPPKFQATDIPLQFSFRSEDLIRWIWMYIISLMKDWHESHILKNDKVDYNLLFKFIWGEGWGGGRSVEYGMSGFYRQDGRTEAWMRTTRAWSGPINWRKCLFFLNLSDLSKLVLYIGAFLSNIYPNKKNANFLWNFVKHNAKNFKSYRQRSNTERNFRSIKDITL